MYPYNYELIVYFVYVKMMLFGSGCGRLVEQSTANCRISDTIHMITCQSVLDAPVFVCPSLVSCFGQKCL